jgi:plastocyanin
MPRSPDTRAVLLLVLLLIPACRADSVVEPTGSDDVFWSLTLDHRSLTLAVGSSWETQQLTATPRNSAGEALEGLPAPTFSTTNVNTVQVTQGGLLTAVGVTAGTLVVASLTVGGVTHADTATVAVTPDPAGLVLSSFSIHPVAPDSAKFALGGTILEPIRTLTPIALDQNGAPLLGLPVRFTSLDRRVATIDPWSGTITGLSIGSVSFVATTTAYGVTLSDTLPYAIGYPANVELEISYPRFGFKLGSFRPDEVSIGVGGVVVWRNSTGGALVDITFDDPTNVGAAPEHEACVVYGAPCDAGNVPAFGPAADVVDFDELSRNWTRARRFNAPGTYHYRSELMGTEGTIVVVDESGS